MKRLLLFFLIAIAVIGASVVSPMLLDDPGRVVIGVGPWELETSLLALAMVVFVLWIGLGLVWGAVRWPARALASRRSTRSRKQLEEGFLALTQGEWTKAEQAFGQSLEHQKSVAGILGAARAAQGRSDFEARDAWLAKADARFGRKHFVTEFARAQLAMDEGRLDHAIELYERLHLKKPKHLGVLRALLQAYQDGGRWRALRELTPALQRAGMIGADKAKALVQLAGKKELAQCEEYGDLRFTWKALGRVQRKDPELVLAFARRAHDLGHHDQAGKSLSKLLDEQLSTEALAVYRLSDETNRATRIEDLEWRLRQQPDHPQLLEALGFLYLDNGDHDKAQTCLEQAVTVQSSAETFQALGRLMDQKGETEKAARYYRSALQSDRSGEQRLLGPGLADNKQV